MKKKNYDLGKIVLRLHRAEVDSFETIKFVNHNFREITLVCKNNRAYRNKSPIVKYTNYYNIPVLDFVISSNKICLDLQKYVTATFEAINEMNPVIIILDRKTKMVTEIVYPDIDPYLDDIAEESEDEVLTDNRELY